MHRTSMWPEQSQLTAYALSFAYILHVVCSNTEATTKKPFKWVEVEKLCTLSTFLSKIGQHASQKAQTIKNAIAAASKVQLQALAGAAATHNTNTSLVYYAISMAAQDCVDQAVEQHDDIVTKGLEATARGANTAGGIAEFISLLKAVSNGGTGTAYCLSVAGNTAATSTKLNGFECKAPEFATTGEPQPFDDKLVSASGFPTINSGSLLDGTDNTKCMFLHKSGGVPAAADLSQSSGPHDFASQLIEVTPANSGSNAAVFSTRNNIASQWKLTGGAADTMPKKLYKALVDLKTVNPTTCGESAENVIENLIQENKVKSMITTVLQAKHPQAKPLDVEGWAQQLIDSIASKTDQQPKKIREALEKVAVKKIEGKNTVDKAVSTVGDDGDLRKSILLQHIMNREAVANLANQFQEEKAKKTNTETIKITETDESCQKKGTGDNCKEGCKEVEEGGKKKCVKDSNYKPQQEYETKEGGVAVSD